MSKRKGLLKSGIDKLEKVMLANAKRYNQDTFGNVSECGTEQCGAGFCYLMEVGQAQFNNEARRHTNAFQNHCLEAGKRRLGIRNKSFPAVFSFSFSISWPDDLSEGFKKARGPKARVRFYINMLRTRANADGSLREKPQRSKG